MELQHFIELIKQGVETWNKWRKEHPEHEIDAGNMSLPQASLQGVHFNKLYLRGANLSGADLSQ
ncbi:MAG: pentapeptide repeat-containing protein, partial [Ktedonobacteraceae bacterium]|nr:pentapeptide repeat-containing protein [Ktedonobacteraceae bacterium]